MSKIKEIKEKINETEESIRKLHEKKFKLKKELLQEIHKFRIGDYVVYEKTNGNLLFGRIDIINNSNKTAGGKVIVYKGNPTNKDDYDIIYLADWKTEPDPRLTVLTSGRFFGG